MTKAFLVVAGLALWTAPGMAAQAQAQAPEAPPAAADDASLDAFVEAQMAEAGIMGLGAAVIVDRKVVWTKGYGFADWQRKLLSDPQTSGGLLVSCASDSVNDVLKIFAEKGFAEAKVIGKVDAGPARLTIHARAREPGAP